MFKIIKTANYDELSDQAFNIIKNIVTTKPDSVLGLATGSSPVGLYQRMVTDHQQNGTSYRAVKTVNLDEYLGLPQEHPESYYSFMQRNLFSKLDIPTDNIHLPEDGADQTEQCRRYDAILDGLNVDLQLLGIGSNGHIGFNEPGTSFGIKTHVVDLNESTLRDNARFFNSIDEVPKQAITMGIASIMQAKQILIIASGENKADAVAAMINGPQTVDVPASALQSHPNVTVIVDAAAAAKL
ncbi:glucosamine-6-phosphate deaminase [Candidatus Saccharibacteria bacterium]|nr:glucosamine-6-phosphate deaminase [Candidatus Saccharibacteria bacterium]